METKEGNAPPEADNDDTLWTPSPNPRGVEEPSDGRGTKLPICLLSGFPTTRAESRSEITNQRQSQRECTRLKKVNARISYGEPEATAYSPRASLQGQTPASTAPYPDLLLKCADMKG